MRKSVIRAGLVAGGAVVLLLSSIAAQWVIMYFQISPPARNQTEKIEPKRPVEEAERSSSPNGTYTVVVSSDGAAGGNTVSIIGKDGKLEKNIITPEESTRMSLGRIPQPYTVSFGRWLSDDRFVLKLDYKDGQQFEYEVDAKAGMGYPETFKPRQS